MTDPRRRNTRPEPASVSPATPALTFQNAHGGPGQPVPEAPEPDRPEPNHLVQIRPVRRPGGQVPTTSIEALSGAGSPAPRGEVQVRAYRDPSRRASASAVGGPAVGGPAGEGPAVKELGTAGPGAGEPVGDARPARARTEATPRVPAQRAAPEPTREPEEIQPEVQPEAGAPRSGWLSSALNDWLKEPEREAAPAPRREQAPTRQAPTRQPQPKHGTRVQTIVRGGGQAAPPQDAPAPAGPTTGTPTANRPLPRTLQEALASDLLPDLPVELLERLWAQEEERQEGRPQEATRGTAETEARPQPARPRPVHTSPVPVPDSPPLPAPPSALGPIPQEVPTLQPMFPGAAPFLARFLPLSAPLQLGLSSRFCDLHAFLKYLHELSWYGYLHVSVGDLSTYALVYEGRVVAAAAVNATGEQALGELLSLYEQGATMATYPLPPTYAHVLSGVGSRAWKFDLTGDFTGLYVHPDGALFYSRGEVVAAMPAGLPYEGAFPAPLRPQTLILPRSFAGWAHRIYVPTLRGRDANNPITSVYHGFREKYGPAGAQLIRALGEGQTPAEYAARADVALHDLEPLLQELTQGGYLKEQQAGR